MNESARIELGMDAVTACETKQAYSPSAMERLRVQKRRREAELLDINNAIAALEANPEIERVLTLVAKAGRH